VFFRHVFTADTLQDLASIKDRRGLFSGALLLYRQALIVRVDALFPQGQERMNPSLTFREVLGVKVPELNATQDNLGIVGVLVCIAK
jgi:hypothetical protein